MKKSIRIINIVTVSMSTSFFSGQLAFMRRRGFKVAICSSPGKQLDEISVTEGVEAFDVSMEREIHPLRDLISLWRLYRLMRAYRPTIVNAGTPKAGLLGMLAARMAGVPIRIYLLRGLRIETTSGVKRLVLWISERLASACAHRVVCISESLRQAYVRMGLARAEKTLVLGAGSSNGVDFELFRTDKYTMEKAQRMRSRFGIPAAAPVIGFVGRLTRDKGIVELAKAYEKLLAVFPQTWLLLVGNLENGDAVPEDTVKWLRNHPQVVMSSYTPKPKQFFAMMNILAFPSYREGFGNVSLEAAAMGLPVVGFKVTGVVDAVQNGVTGILTLPGDVESFTAALMKYLGDSQLRRKHGTAGRQRILKHFQQESLWHRWADLYNRLLEENGLPTPAMPPKRGAA